MIISQPLIQPRQQRVFSKFICEEDIHEQARICSIIRLYILNPSKELYRKANNKSRFHKLRPWVNKKNRIKQLREAFSNHQNYTYLFYDQNERTPQMSNHVLVVPDEEQILLDLMDPPERQTRFNELTNIIVKDIGWLH